MNDREQFEKYAESQGLRDFEYDQDDASRYRNPFTQREWKYWAAALDCVVARATPAQPVGTKTYQQRADDAGLTVRTKESLFDYAIAEIVDLRAICKHDAAEQGDIAKRLRRVAKAAGVPVDGDDSFVYGVAFALLGQIASALESKPSPSSVGAAIRALPLPDTVFMAGCHGNIEIYTPDQMRALLSEAAALAEQVQGQQTGPDLYEAEKLLPYEIRYFKTPGMAEGLGYRVLTKYRKIAAPSIAQDGQKSEET